MENPVVTQLKANMAHAVTRTGAKHTIASVQQNLQGQPTTLKGSVDYVVTPAIMDGDKEVTPAVVQTVDCFWSIQGNCLLSKQDASAYDLVVVTPFTDFVATAPATPAA